MDYEEKVTMHSPKMISGLIITAEITGWVMLVLYLLSFASDMSSLAQNFAMAWPTSGVMDQLMFIAGIIFKPAIAAFYFLTMQGIAQLLALGVDIFYNTDVEYETIIEEVEEVVE